MKKSQQMKKAVMKTRNEIIKYERKWQQMK